MKYYTTSKISENIHKTPEGYLVCVGVPIAGLHEMTYSKDEVPNIEPDDDGTISITRDEKELFRPGTMASFNGKVITIRHPEEFVGPDNWGALAKGVLQNIRRGEGDQGDDLLADLLITDKMAIGLVNNGLREVSCGYEADFVEVGKGKGKQKNIVGNHLALVDQGRAGPGYAINDHKGAKQMKLSEKIKAIFAKAQDEAMELAKDEDKDMKGKDEDKDKEKKDEAGYDELVSMVKDLGEKISAMAPKKDEDKDADKDKKADDKDDDKAKDEEGGMEERLKALEAAVSKLLEKKAGDEGEESEDEDDMEDDDFEESTLTGDTSSRAEILAPGIKASKDVKAKALKAAYETEEGKKVIDSLNGGKAPAYDSAEKVNALFIAASEVLKAARKTENAKSKRVADYDSGSENTGAISAEKMNEINAKFYKKA